MWLQLVSARADTDQWKRRAGVLFLKMSSIQEDVDMYSMRCRLLEAEISRESKRTQSFKVTQQVFLHCISSFLLWLRSVLQTAL